MSDLDTYTIKLKLLDLQDELRRRRFRGGSQELVTEALVGLLLDFTDVVEELRTEVLTMKMEMNNAN